MQSICMGFMLPFTGKPCQVDSYLCPGFFAESLRLDFLSKTIYGAAKNELDMGSCDTGEQAVKGIPEPEQEPWTPVQKTPH